MITLWIIATLLFSIAWHFWIYPFLKVKFFLFKTWMMMKRMRRKYPDIKEFDELVKLSKKLYKETKLNDKDDFN